MPDNIIKNRFQGLFLVIALLTSILLSPLTAVSQTLTQATLEDTLTRYEEYSRVFYRIASRGLSAELIELEEYLTFMIKSVNNQLSQREDIAPEDIASLSPLELNQIALRSAKSRKNNVFARKFEIWKQFQLNEVYLKIDKAVQLKRRIWQKSSSAQRKEMFDYDLESACLKMSDTQKLDYQLAIRIFNHIIDFYDYKNIDDIIFYRSEAYYGAAQYISALKGYKRLMVEFPQSEYFEKALYRCMALAYNSGDLEAVDQLYSLVMERGEEQWIYKKDLIHYMQGTGRFLSGEYERTKTILAKVSDNSNYSFSAKYIQAHSLYRMGETDAALKLFDEILLTGAKDTLIWDETAVIIGDILLTLENRDDAWGYFRLVPEESSLFPRALIGQAAVRFFRSEYDTVLTLVDSVLNHYSNNNYRYQALCFKGALLKKMDLPYEAQELYDRLLEESGVKIDLVNYLTEKLKLIYLVNTLNEKESEALATGSLTIFNDYWRIRSRAERMLKRVAYSTILEVDPEFDGYLKEKSKLISMVDGFIDLSEDVLESNNVSLLKKYRNLRDNLSEVNMMIQASGYGRVQKLPFYYQVTKAEFRKETLDSLYQVTSGEIERLENQLEDMSLALTIAGDDVSLEKKSEMIEVANNVRNWRKNLDQRISKNLDSIEPLPRLDLTRWSHIAFHKTLVPGTDFNDLKEKQQRIEAIYEFLRTIDNITYRMSVEEE